MQEAINKLLMDVDLCHVCPYENDISDEYIAMAAMVEEWCKISPVYAAKESIRYVCGKDVSLRKNGQNYKKFITLKTGLINLCALSN